MVGTGSVASVASATASLTSLWFQTPDGLVLWFSISRIYSPHPAPAPTCANSGSGLDGGLSGNSPEGTWAPHILLTESQLFSSLQSGGGPERMSCNEWGDHGKQMEVRQKTR